jgi:DNA-binding transcriptional LysR family regulator
MRVLSGSPQRLVAAPALMERHGSVAHPADLAGMPSLDWGPQRDHAWALVGPDGAEARVSHAPRYITDDMTVLRQAAIKGVGVVQLPYMVVEDALAKGTLVDVIPGWKPKGGLVHAVFPSRRGLLPAVRQLIDYLAEHIQKDE